MYNNNVSTTKRTYSMTAASSKTLL